MTSEGCVCVCVCGWVGGWVGETEQGDEDDEDALDVGHGRDVSCVCVWLCVCARAHACMHVYTRAGVRALRAYL